eukprot:SAG22_NODE_2680_length_2314_cov_1.149436_3_plen_105_part_00
MSCRQAGQRWRRRRAATAPLLAQPPQPVLADHGPLLAAVDGLDLHDLHLRVGRVGQVALDVEDEAVILHRGGAVSGVAPGSAWTDLRAAGWSRLKALTIITGEI